MLYLHCEFCHTQPSEMMLWMVSDNMYIKKGFCPEWLRLWSASSCLLSQHLPHSVHLNLPLWTFIWQRSPPWDEKRFPHWLQVYQCSPLASLQCEFCHSHPASVHQLCCCAYNVYVAASRWTGWNFCYTANTCTASLPCGFACDHLDFRTE